MTGAESGVRGTARVWLVFTPGEAGVSTAGGFLPQPLEKMAAITMNAKNMTGICPGSDGCKDLAGTEICFINVTGCKMLSH